MIWEGRNGKRAILEIYLTVIDWGMYLPDSGAQRIAAECLVLFCTVQYRSRSLDLGTHTAAAVGLIGVTVAEPRFL